MTGGVGLDAIFASFNERQNGPASRTHPDQYEQAKAYEKLDTITGDALLGIKRKVWMSWRSRNAERNLGKAHEGDEFCV